MSTGLQLLQDIEVEMVKLAHAYEVVAGELTKRANEEMEEQVAASPYRYGQYAGAVGAGVGAGALAGGADAYRAARAQNAISMVGTGGGNAHWAPYRNDMLKSLGKKVGVGAGVGALGAAGLAAYHSRGGNEPVMIDDGQTKAASLKALLSYVR